MPRLTKGRRSLAPQKRQVTPGKTALASILRAAFAHATTYSRASVGRHTPPFGITPVGTLKLQICRRLRVYTPQRQMGSFLPNSRFWMELSAANGPIHHQQHQPTISNAVTMRCASIRRPQICLLASLAPSAKALNFSQMTLGWTSVL